MKTSCLIIILLAAITLNSCEEKRYKNDELTEKTKIVVTNKAIQKINGRYRYLFDVRNKDKQEARISIIFKCFPTDGDLKEENTHQADIVIPSGKGGEVYFDLETPPVQIDSLKGIKEYAFEISIDNELSQKGGDKVSENYKDTVK